MHYVHSDLFPGDADIHRVQLLLFLLQCSELAGNTAFYMSFDILI